MTKSQIKKRKKQAARWPIWLAIGGAVIVIAAVVLALAGKPDEAEIKVTGAPAVEVDQSSIDYGKVKLGSLVTARVKVTNVGDQTLRFNQQPYVELIEGC